MPYSKNFNKKICFLYISLILYTFVNAQANNITAVIDIIDPIIISKGEIVYFKGHAEPEDNFSSYRWEIVPLFNGIVFGKSLLISTSKSFSYKDLSTGVWRVSFYVQNQDLTWSNPAKKDITVNNVTACDIKLDNQNLFFENINNKKIEHAFVGDWVYIKAKILNKGDISIDNTIVVSAYEENDSNMDLIKSIEIETLNISKNITIPWHIGYDSQNNQIDAYNGGNKIIHLKAAQKQDTVIDKNNQNNMITNIFNIYPQNVIDEPDINISINKPSINYTDQLVNISGQVFYNQKPAFGKYVNIEFSGQRYFAATYYPYGNFSCNIKMPSNSGNYNLTASLKDNNFYNQESISLKVDNNSNFYNDIKINFIKFSGESIFEKNNQLFSFTDSPIQISAQIINNGNDDILDDFEILFYEGYPGTGHLLGTAIANEPLKKNSSIWVDCFDSNLRWNPETKGLKTIYAVVDSSDDISEIDEYNNSTSTDIKIIDCLPDLTFSLKDSIKLSKIFPVKGDTLQIYSSIANYGYSKLSADILVDIDFYLKNFQDENFIEIGNSYLLDYIDPGDQRKRSINFITTDLNSGYYTIRAIIDDNNKINEINKDNNIFEYNFYLGDNKEDISFVDLTATKIDNNCLMLNTNIQNYSSIDSQSRTISFYYQKNGEDKKILTSILTDIIPAFSSREYSIKIDSLKTDEIYYFFASLEGDTISCLYNGNEKADLTIQKITISPENPESGQKISVLADITNVGQAVSKIFQVQFYYRNPYFGYQKLGESIYINELKPDFVVQVKSSEEITGIDPFYSIYVNIMPFDINDDTSLSNNDAYKDVIIDYPYGVYANAGQDQNVILGQIIYLDASLSKNYNRLQWLVVNKPALSLANLSSAMNIIKPKFFVDIPGDYQVILKAFNNDFFHIDMININVSEGIQVNGKVLTSIVGYNTHFYDAQVNVNNVYTTNSDSLGNYTLTLPQGIQYINLKAYNDIDQAVYISENTISIEPIIIPAPSCTELFSQQYMDLSINNTLKKYDIKSDKKIDISEVINAMNNISNQNEQKINNLSNSCLSMIENKNKSNISLAIIPMEYESGIIDNYNRSNEEKSSPGQGLINYIQNKGKIPTTYFDDIRTNKAFINSFYGFSTGIALCCISIEIHIKPISGSSYDDTIIYGIFKDDGETISSQSIKLADFIGYNWGEGDLNSEIITINIERNNSKNNDFLDLLNLYNNLDICVSEDTSVDYIKLTSLSVVEAGQITGKVMTYFPGYLTHVTNAKVQLKDTNLYSITDLNGNYIIDHVPHGTYTIEAVSDYLSASQTAYEISIFDNSKTAPTFYLNDLKCNGIYTKQEIDQAVDVVQKKFDIDLNDEINLKDLIYYLKVISGFSK